MSTAVISIENALDYIMGGNSHFTVVRGDERFTYKILHCEPDGQQEYYRVSVLNGPDNVNNYRQIASIMEVDGMPKIVNRSTSAIKSPAFLMIEKLYYNLIFTQFEMLANYEVWHTGRCSRCGRLLTVPDSIQKGIGPECETKINAFISQYIDL